MMLKKLNKKQKKQLIVGGFVALFLISLGTGAIRFGGDELDIIRPLFSYAEGTYTVSVLGVPNTLESGETVSVLVNDEVSINVQVHWDSTRNHPPKIQCKIIDSFFGIFYQDEAWDTININDDYEWNFDLKDLPTGNYVYHFEFVGYYPNILEPTSIYDGQSFYFNIDKQAEQIPDEPSIWEEPDDFEMTDVSSRELIWEYQYGSTGTITLSVDGDVVDTEDFTGNSAGQIYRYTFNPNPTEIGNYIIKFSLDPDDWRHSTIESIVNVGVITYNVIDGIPDAVDGVAIRMDGQLSTVGWALTHQWIEDKDTVPADVYNLPKTGNLRITVIGELAGSYDISAFTEVEVIVRNPTMSDKTFNFDLQVGVEPTWYSFMFGVQLTTWYEGNINLDSFDAGEYEFELRCEYNGVWYKVSTFNITVNTLPIGWLVSNAGLMLAIAIGSVVMIKLLREGKGWWGFQGKYGRYKK